jgi:hypothetical protein
MTRVFSKTDLVAALIVVFLGISIGFGYYVNLWKVGADGLSPITQKLRYWDFTNLWAGGLLASKGNVSLIFDVDAYRIFLREIFTPRLADQEWSYPPSMLLIGVPLSQMPLPIAYGVWTLGSIVALHFALRPLSLPPLAQVACLLSPSGLINASLGQNGALTAALLIGGLSIVFSRPVLAGVFFGILTMKPHLGLLIPICLIASGSYRAFLSASLTAIGLFLLTGFAFGFDVWAMFVEKTAPMMSAIMEAPYPQGYHSRAVTVFIMSRWLGFGVMGAYIVQVAVMVICGGIVAWLWRPMNLIEHRMRVCVTATLAVIASPYGYSYDIIPMCITVALLFVTEAGRSRLALAFFWLSPLFIHLLNQRGIGISVLVPVLVVAYALSSGMKQYALNAENELKAS